MVLLEKNRREDQKVIEAWKKLLGNQQADNLSLNQSEVDKIMGKTPYQESPYSYKETIAGQNKNKNTCNDFLSKNLDVFDSITIENASRSMDQNFSKILSNGAYKTFSNGFSKSVTFGNYRENSRLPAFYSTFSFDFSDLAKENPSEQIYKHQSESQDYLIVFNHLSVFALVNAALGGDSHSYENTSKSYTQIEIGIMEEISKNLLDGFFHSLIKDKYKKDLDMAHDRISIKSSGNNVALIPFDTQKEFLLNRFKIEINLNCNTQQELFVDILTPQTLALELNQNKSNSIYEKEDQTLSLETLDSFNNEKSQKFIEKCSDITTNVKAIIKDLKTDIDSLYKTYKSGEVIPLGNVGKTALIKSNDIVLGQGEIGHFNKNVAICLKKKFNNKFSTTGVTR